MEWGKHWILDENKKVKQVDLATWAQWYEDSIRSKARIVRQEWIGDSWVSTVFLALDHNWTKEGPPVLWETMVFSNRSIDQHWMFRCSGNWEQAEAMHEEMVLKVCEVEGLSPEQARKEQNERTS